MNSLSGPHVASEKVQLYRYYILDGFGLGSKNSLEIEINKMASLGWRLITVCDNRWHYFEALELERLEVEGK